MLAEVILRRPGNADSLPRADRIAHSTPSQETVQKAAELLEQRGIHVVQRGIISLTVECSAPQFDDVFGDPLAPRVPEELRQYVERVLLPGRHSWFGS